MKIIHYNRIDKNIKEIKKTNDLCLVLKNDAYGFGMKEVLEIAIKNNVSMFAVNTIEEAIKLRGYCDKKIILFGYAISYIYDLKKYHILPTASSKEEIDIFRENHIFYALEIDCGMNRFGIKNYTIDLFKDIYLDTVYVHFYKDLTKNIETIDKISKLCLNYNKAFHFGGSLLYGKTNYCLRVGKIIYQNAFAFYGKVCFIKNIVEGETIGYEAEYRASKKERIAVLDVGYYNGLKLHYNGYVFFKNKKYKVIGRICMNHCFVLIDDDVRLGDIMEFFGDNISLEEFLEFNQMSEYESFLSLR